MGDVFTGIGESLANLVGAGPQGGPLGGFKPYAQTVDDIAAVVAAPFTGGASLAIPAAFALEDTAKGNYLGAIGNVGAVVGGAYGAGIGPFAPAAGAAGAGAGAGASAAGVVPSFAADATAAGATGGGDLASAVPTVSNTASTFDVFGQGAGAASAGAGAASVPATALPGSFLTPAASAGLNTTAIAPDSGGFLSSLGIGATAPTAQGLNPVGSGGFGQSGAFPGGMTANQALVQGLPGTSSGGAGTGGGGGGGAADVLKGTSGPSFGQAAKTLFNQPSLGNLGTLAGTINPGVALGAAGLGLEAMRSQNLPQIGNLQGAAGNLAGQGAALQNILQSGQLPAGAQSAIDQATESAKASIRSQYAQMGLSGSTMETQALASADQQAASQKFNIVNQLVTQGVGETEAAAGLYQNIMQAQLQQDNALGSAIGNFGAALAGGGNTIRLNVGGGNG